MPVNYNAMQCNNIFSLQVYSAQNNNWDWKFEVCLFSRPTLSSALNITRYQQVTTIQIVFSLRSN